jgi:catechol 2,3-dioxygenase-like lactoylglutathione lyase family enzyme
VDTRFNDACQTEDAMEIRAFNHIGINIKDIDESLAFYKKVFMPTAIRKYEFKEYDIYFLFLNRGVKIELFDYKGRNKRTDVEESRVGYRHIAFETFQLEAWARHITGCGADIVLPLTEVPELRMKVFLIRDPNGIVLELCQPM